MPSANAERESADRAGATAHASPPLHATVAERLGGMRLAWVAGWLTLGVVLGLSNTPPITPAAWSVIAILATAIAMASRGPAWASTMALGVVCAGAAWAGLRAPHRPSEPWRSLGGQPFALIEAEGIIAAPPRLASTQRGALAEFALVRSGIVRSELLVERVRTNTGWQDAPARVWLRLDDPSTPIELGQRVRVMGRFVPLHTPLNPGEPDRRASAAQRGIVGSLRSPGGDLLRAIGPAGGAWELRAWWHTVRLRGMRALRLDRADDGSTMSGRHPSRTTDDPLASGRLLLAALVLGHRSSDDAEGFDAYTTVGIAHLLAVSGLHLGLLVAMAMLVVRLVADRPNLEVCVVLAVVLLYTLLVPARPPILRAAIMASVLTLGLVGRRRYPPMNLLGLAAIVTLLIWPADVLTPGFQLSFLVVGSLIAGVSPMRELAERWRDPLGLKPPMPMAMRWTVDAVSSATIAWLASLPIVLAHFGLISWLSIPATIIATPPIALLLGWGFLAVLVGFFSPEWGQTLGDPAAWLAWRIDALARAAAEWPGAATHAPLLPAWSAACATGLIFAALLTIPRGTALLVPMRAWRGAIAAASLAVLLMAAGAWQAGQLPGKIALRWHALAVGDGSCHLLRTRQHALFFDAGSMWFGVGLRTIPLAAKATGGPPIPTAIISHADVDHFSGLIDSARPLGLQRVLLPGSFIEQARVKPSGPAAAMLDRLKAMHIEALVIGAGDELELGNGVRALVLHPPTDLAPRTDNEGSIVLLIEVPTRAGIRRLLMTGDLEAQGVTQVRASLDALGWPTIDAMEAPHHGSPADPATIDLIRAIDPRLIVQSSGPRRLNDPRWASTAARSAWLSTPIHGAATITFNNDGTIRATTHTSPHRPAE